VTGVFSMSRSLKGIVVDFQRLSTTLGKPMRHGCDMKRAARTMNPERRRNIERTARVYAKVIAKMPRSADGSRVIPQHVKDAGSVTVLEDAEDGKGGYIYWIKFGGE
jgi:hypothetical protein